MHRVFYGWWIVLGSFVLQALGGGLLFNSFGAYFVYLQADFGWSRTLIAGAISIARLQSGILGPFQGWLLNRLGARGVVYLGIAMFGGGFLILSRIDSVFGFYVALVLIAIGSNLAGFLTVNIVLVNWFVRWRARAISLGAMGASLAGLLVPVVAWSLETHGWRTTALASGMLVFAVGVPVALLFRTAPEPYGYAPDGTRPRSVPESLAADRSGSGAAARAPREASTPQPDAGNLGMTAREALQTPAFWLLVAGHTAALVAVSSLIVLLIPFLVEERGFGVDGAARIVAGLTGMSVVGMLMGGYLGDRLEKRLISAVCMVGHTLALVMIAVSPVPAIIVLGSLLHGLCWGIRGPLMMAMRADYFGRRAFATIEGIASVPTTIGLFLGPVIVGFVADQWGTYVPGFAMLTVITAAGFFAFLLARPPTLHPLPVPSAADPSRSAQAV